MVLTRKSLHRVPLPAPDGAAVQIGDGTDKPRALTFYAGQFPLPRWIRFNQDNSKVTQVSSLPATVFGIGGSYELLTADPTGGVVCEAAGGADCWYVAPGGSGPGTFADPFGSIQQAIDAAAPGDFIYVRAGTFGAGGEFGPGDGGSPGNLVTLKVYPTEAVLLSGAGIDFSLSNGGYIVVDGFEVNGASIGTGGFFPGIIGITVRNVHVHHKQMDMGNNALIGMNGNINPTCPRDVVIEDFLLHNTIGEGGEPWNADPDREHHAGIMVQGGTRLADPDQIAGPYTIRRGEIYQCASAFYWKFDYISGGSLIEDVVVHDIQQLGQMRNGPITLRRLTAYNMLERGFAFENAISSTDVHDVVFEDWLAAHLTAAGERLFSVGGTQGSAGTGFIFRRMPVYVAAGTAGVASGLSTGQISEWDRNTYMVPVGAANGLDILGGRNLAQQRAVGLDLNSIVLEGAPTDFFQDPDNGDYTPIGELAKHHAQPVVTKASATAPFLLDGVEIARFGLRTANALQDDTIAQRLIDNFAHMKAHGIQSFCMNMMGGRGEENGNSFFNAFNADGSIKSAFADRLVGILDAARAADMVPVLQLFYRGRDQELTNDAAALNAVDQVVALIAPYRGMWLQLVNEPAHGGYDLNILTSPVGLQSLYSQAKNADPGRLVYVHSITDAHDDELVCVDTWQRICDTTQQGAVTIESDRYDSYLNPGIFQQAEIDQLISDLTAGFNAGAYWFGHGAWHQLADGTAGFPHFDKGGDGISTPGMAFMWDEMLAVGGAA